MYKNKKQTKVYGWSRNCSSSSYYFKTSSIDEVNSIFRYASENNKKISFRSGGLSYGDNTLNDNNIIINFINNNGVIGFNESTGLIDVAGSCAMIDILKYSIPRGWLLSVCPASQFITLSGAISNNVHGKNCFQKGYFGDHVEEIKLYTFPKGIITCSKEKNQDYFYSIISGIGCYGLILSAKIQLRKIKTIILETKTTFVRNLTQAIMKMDDLKVENEFNIGSLNFSTFNKNNISGRIYSSKFSNGENLSIGKHKPQTYIYLINYILLLNKFPVTKRMVEYLLSLIVSNRHNIKSYTKQNFFQMNFLNDINLPIYNYIFKNGFVEYQVVFDSSKFFDGINEIHNLLKEDRRTSYLSSMKAYKAANEKYNLGLRKNGYCITLDIPFEKGAKFDLFIRKLNEITINYGGQVYLGKTPCLNHEEFKEMYPHYYRYEKIKLALDPNNLIRSNMSSRLFNLS